MERIIVELQSEYILAMKVNYSIENALLSISLLNR